MYLEKILGPYDLNPQLFRFLSVDGEKYNMSHLNIRSRLRDSSYENAGNLWRDLQATKHRIYIHQEQVGDTVYTHMKNNLNLNRIRPITGAGNVCSASPTSCYPGLLFLHRITSLILRKLCSR